VPVNTAPGPDLAPPYPVKPVHGHADTPPRPLLPHPNLARRKKREAEQAKKKAAANRFHYPRKPKIAIYVTLSKECMIDIMEKYGPTEWRGVTREP
jgi:hypothetical protein